ncbi:MAG: helix-turn-helix domain-containing protein [Planctomycetota bacterium]|jgi:hypothetical protein
MAPPFEGTYVARDPAQRRALTSPLRLEILEHFLGAPMSVADLAARMGRRPDSLYYHVRTLADVGLLVPAGTRKRGKRDEALYQLVAPTIEMAGDLDDPAVIDDALKAFAAGWRAAERELRDALESGRPRTRGHRRNHLCIRQRCCLRPKALEQVNRHLDAIQKVIDREFRRPPAPDEISEHCSFTLAVVPLAGRGGDR